jgi:3-methyladenine DNA glycosylase AlkD
MVAEVYTQIQQALQFCADEKIAQSAQKYFTGEKPIKMYGVKIPEVRKIGSAFKKQIKPFTKKQVLALCQLLWQNLIYEEAILACILTESLRTKYELQDFLVFEKYLKKYVNNWATCDTFCCRTLGVFLLKYPEVAAQIMQWAKHKNIWVQRAAAVSFIVAARKGLMLQTSFAVAQTLLTSKQPMVQKGYGWLLKEATRKNQKAVFAFVLQHKQNMPRTALRYAIEKMPTSLKQQAMQ